MAIIGTFYAGIGALVWHPKSDTYLLLKRSMAKDFAAGAWECVTGRVDQGEGFGEALHREVREETGLTIEPISMLGTTCFHRGEERPDNELLGVVYFCMITDGEGNSLDVRPEIQKSLEHDMYRWVSAEQAREFLNVGDSSEHWLLRVLEKAEFIKEHLPQEIIDYHRQFGFEIDTF
jgi:8-oxo-dGTP diphosphatase